MPNISQSNLVYQRKLEYYVRDIFNYMETLLGLPDLNLSQEFQRNIYDLFSDIVSLYGEGMMSDLKRSGTPQLL